jgi:hypothetical protein
VPGLRPCNEDHRLFVFIVRAPIYSNFRFSGIGLVYLQSEDAVRVRSRSPPRRVCAVCHIAASVARSTLVAHLGHGYDKACIRVIRPSYLQTLQ